jgi:hypothetical protein
MKATALLERSPETFSYAVLSSNDFDGTIARTFDPSPNRIGITEAYRHAIGVVLGGTALETYLATPGEHSNRAPMEIVSSLDPNLEDSALVEATSALIDAKLEILMNEVGRHADGSMWPKAVDGFLPLWERIYEQRREGALIDTSIISSGHTPFIEKIFRELWDMPLPDILITDDTVRQHYSHIPIADVVKPSPFMMQLAQKRWAIMYRLEGVPQDDNYPSRIIYAGDDAVKDGGLAANAGVDFVRIEQHAPEEGWLEVGRWIRKRVLQDRDRYE